MFLFLLLLQAALFQGFDQVIGEVDRPVARFGLRAGLEAFAVMFEDLLDAQQLALEIDVLPAQPKDFALTHAGMERDQAGQEMAVFDGVRIALLFSADTDELLDLIDRPNLHLLMLHFGLVDVGGRVFGDQVQLDGLVQGRVDDVVDFFDRSFGQAFRAHITDEVLQQERSEFGNLEGADRRHDVVLDVGLVVHAGGTAEILLVLHPVIQILAAGHF